ncbi:dimethyladenosine transferase 2, mitochondrial-like isoform X1 [Centruroides sculpturatus]|uniref:dimethyladenosine transferase 2, mitochondrial-like isoform X1 n=1 Tax=Centruroides sculpturatus TaxID=218467 RepID=UPI000C6E2F55|nr:dimethyladenosine transferase 2, mitochondrial-like isoform X1 [Centruroides sculpturatus]XP_023242763.1 dimethyladenosine transferase 2, mitochondrial-like isoform X1 [Centruroides sculpturatus]
MALNTYYKWRFIRQVRLRFSWDFSNQFYLWNPVKRYLNVSNVLHKQKAKNAILKHKIVAEKYRNILKKNEDNPYISKRYKNCTYVIHDDVVELVLQNISSDLAKEDALIIEINPGFGILSKALLESGVSQLKLIEDNRVFLPHLLELSELYPGKVQLINRDFYRMFKIPEDSETENDMSQIVEGAKIRKWNEEPPLKIFLILPFDKSYFLRRMIYSLECENSIYRLGRVEFLMFVSGKEYAYMIAGPKDNFMKYRQVSVLYQLFFDIELIEKIPKEHFYTIFKNKKRKRVFYDDSNLYFVKIIPKKDMFNDNMTLQKLTEFIYFVRFNLAVRKSLILPALERLIPDCGPHFIKYGLAIYTRFGDVTPEQILDIFNIFISLPGYNDGLFKDLFSDELSRKHQDETCDLETNIE